MTMLDKNKIDRISIFFGITNFRIKSAFGEVGIEEAMDRYFEYSRGEEC